MFSFIEKAFFKSYSHFPISAIFGEFGLIFLRFLQEVNLWGCYLTYEDYRKWFSFIEKVFSKSYRHFRISAIFEKFGVIF